MLFRTARGMTQNRITSCRARRWFEATKGIGGFFVVHRPKTPAQAPDHGPAILPATKARRMTHEMDDTGLDRAVRKGCVDRLAETLEAVCDGDRDARQTSGSQGCSWRAARTSPLVDRYPQAPIRL